MLRQVGKFLKPTTAALQTFGHLATRNRVELTAAQLEALLRAKTLPLSLTLEPGYVILACEGHLVGCGLYTPGRLHSQLPQRHVAPLRFESDD
ncbi:MAG: hypothetical protein KatS3mg131_1169 [Candidatus Tectimicrobiota bacterium]|nr:MAG: hypothetical protein KatS3mg131_1169 [Candidatus Tectomicrobia bacterium]